jgi:hypothetical protein
MGVNASKRASASASSQRVRHPYGACFACRPFQVLILGDQTLTEIADKHADVRPHKAALQMLLDQGMADQAQVNAKLDSLAPFMPKIFADWESSNLKSFDLTSVGIAIAHANIKRFAGEFARLSTWIE